MLDGIVNHVLLQSGPVLNKSLSQLVHVLHFLADRTNGRAIATLLRLSSSDVVVVCL